MTNGEMTTRLRGRRYGRRRGVAVVFVLGLISIALALAYSLLRSQSSVVLIQANTNLRSQARQAAVTGLMVGLQKMSSTGWTGVGSTLVGSLSQQDSYSVSYTAGDATIAASDPSQPYRVTLLSTGYSTDTLQSSQQASYRARAVVQLSPRQLGPQPNNWAAMQNYTFYETGTAAVSVDPPFQIAGPVYLQGSLALGADYNWVNPVGGKIEPQFLGDLNQMRLNGLSDYRPLTGNISLPTASTGAKTLALLTTSLGLTTTNVPAGAATNLLLPSHLTSYQIYPGGPSYNVGAAATTLTNTSLTADVQQNPLGIFFNSNSITVGSNVTISGTLISGGSVTITGTNVQLTPLNMPALSGTTAPVQLPAVAAVGQVACSAGTGATINGSVLAGQSFAVAAGSQSSQMALSGRVIAGGLTIGARSEWLNFGSWASSYQAFVKQPLIPYFPLYQYLLAGLSYKPLLTIAPSSTVVANQWQDLSAGPVYVVNPADGGLRWTLVSWTDNV